MTLDPKSLALGFTIILISVISLAGNLLSLIILFRPKFKLPVYTFLCALIASDFLFIVQFLGTWGVYFTCNGFGACQDYLLHYSAYVNYFVIACLYIVQNNSVFLTVAISVDRYVAVCHPLKASSILTVPAARKITIFISAFSILCHVARFWLNRVVDFVTEDSEGNINIGKDLDISRSQSEDPKSLFYWANWINIMLSAPIPFLILIVLNSRIVVQLRKMTRRRSSLTRMQISEMSTSRLVVAVVVAFGLCNLTNAVARVFPLNSGGLTFRIIGNLLIALGSAINFILYCTLGTLFRREFIEIFCSCTSNPQTEQSNGRNLHPVHHHQNQRNTI